MAMAIQMVDLTTAAAAADQVRRIVIPEEGQGLLELILLHVTVRSEVPTGGAPSNEILARQQCQSSHVIGVGKVHLG